MMMWCLNKSILYVSRIRAQHGGLFVVYPLTDLQPSSFDPRISSPLMTEAASVGEGI